MKQAQRNRRMAGKEDERDERNEKKSNYWSVRCENFCCFTSRSIFADFESMEPEHLGPLLWIAKHTRRRKAVQK